MASELRYSPQFRDEIRQAVEYITYQLKNPIAASALIDAFDQAASSVAEFPLSINPWPTLRAHPLPYRAVQVKHYLAFYVVDGDTVEFRRFLYARSDLPTKLDQ